MIKLKLIKIILLSVFMASSAAAQIVVVNPGGPSTNPPIEPPDRQPITVRPDPTKPGGGDFDGRYYEYCGPSWLGYRCNFLRSDGVAKMRDQSNVVKDVNVAVQRRALEGETAKVDNDLNALREGLVSPNSPAGINIKEKRDAAAARNSNAALYDDTNFQAQKTASQVIDSTAGVSFGLAYTESDKKDYESDAKKVNLVIGERFIKPKIQQEQDRADAIEEQIKSGAYPDKDRRLEMVGNGRIALQISAESLQEGDVAKSNFALKVGTVFLDVALSIFPVTAWPKDCVEAISGHNALTGEELSGFEQTMAWVGVFSVGIGSKLSIVSKAAVFLGIAKKAKGAEEVVKITKVAGKAAEVATVAKKYGFNSVDEAKSFARNFEEVNEAGFKGVLYPRGVGAASGAVPAGHVPVSRWISESEVKAWYSGGGTRIPPDIGAGGRVYVTTPGAPRPGGTGGSRVDFSLPESMLNKAGNEGWFQIFQETANTPIYNVKIFLE